MVTIFEPNSGTHERQPAHARLSVYSPRDRLNDFLTRIVRTTDRTIGRSVIVGVLSSAIALAIVTPFIAPANSDAQQRRVESYTPVAGISCDTFNPEEFIKSGSGNAEKVRRTGERTWDYEDPSRPVANVKVPPHFTVSQLRTRGSYLLPDYVLDSGDFTMICHDPPPQVSGEALQFPARPDEAENILGGTWKTISGNTFSRTAGPEVTIEVPAETTVIADTVYLPGQKLRASRFSVTHYPRPNPVILVR